MKYPVVLDEQSAGSRRASAAPSHETARPDTLHTRGAAPGRRRLGFFYGLLGVIGFSVTLPATRLALEGLDAMFVGFGRAVVAGTAAAAVLLYVRPGLPTRRQFAGLAVVAAGAVLGFPVLSAFAMRALPSSHGAVVLAIIPLATAAAAVWRNRERPSPRFWFASGAGSLIVIAFTVIVGAGRPQIEDIILLAGVAAAAMGYAEGGRLSRELGGWQVISWALVLAAPVAVVPASWAAFHGGLDAPPSAWLGFGYVCLVSQYVAFIAWYNGMALNGVARTGQLQLLQPFFTITAGALILGEALEPVMIAAAGLVVLCVAMGRGMWPRMLSRVR